MSSLITILVALFVFAIMVVVHEFGHFITAKLFKINVVEFAVGMGPAIFKKKYKETTYSLRCIPFGGYCMFDDDVGNDTSPNAFERAAWYKRLCVALAGAFLNLVLGFLVFVMLQSANPTTYRPIITNFIEQTNLQASALRVGDKIVRLNDTKIHIKDDIDFFMQTNGDTPVLVTAKRGEKIVQDTITPVKTEYIYTYSETQVTLTTIVGGVQIRQESVPAPAEPEYKNYIGQTATITQYLLGFESTPIPRSIGSVLYDAFYTTLYNVKIVYVSLWNLLLGRVGADQVSGPIGIVSVIGQATQIGWQPLLSLVGLLTVNLGIMNLLPIPGLDGCKALTLIFEGITRRKLPKKLEGIITLVGFTLLILLMLWATFNDIQNLFIK